MILVNNSTGGRLAFYDVPKVASTSVKKLFIDVIGLGDHYDFYGEEYIDESGNRVSNTEASKEYKERKHHKGKTLDFHALASNRPFQYLKDQPGPHLTAMAVVRDPRDRFISCYNHLVLVNKEYDWTPEQALELVIKGRMPNNHFFPQVHFLGKKADYFDYLYNMNQLDKMAEDLCFYFNKDPKEIGISHYQTSGSSLPFPQSTTEIEEMVAEAYRDDYEAFGEILR